MPEKTMYGIANKNGHLYTLVASGNGESDNCGSYQAVLDGVCSCNPPWLTVSREKAEQVLTGSVQWYNSDLENPQFYPSNGDHVIEVVLTY